MGKGAFCGWCGRPPARNRKGGPNERFYFLKPDFLVQRNFPRPAGEQEYACTEHHFASIMDDFDPRQCLKKDTPEPESTSGHPGVPSDHHLSSAAPAPQVSTPETPGEPRCKRTLAPAQPCAVLPPCGKSVAQRVPDNVCARSCRL